MKINSDSMLIDDLRQGFLRYLSLFMLMTLGLFTTSLYAQTLKTNDNLPTLDACYKAEEFTVRIQKGSTACPDGQLKFTMPAGIEYQLGSAKLDGNPIADLDASITGTTLKMAIPAGPNTEELVITYMAKANCDAIASSGGLEVAYILSGCGPEQTGESNVINIDYAVLKVEVTPSITEGLIGDLIQRTIKVSNAGNGGIQGFTLPVTYGAGLERVSGGDSGDWSFDNTTNTYTYLGTLASGNTLSSISFVEVIKVLACEDLTSSYSVFYGCNKACETGPSNLVSPSISIDQSKRPIVKISKKTTPEITCLNEKFKHVWTIKNEGTAIASSFQLAIGTSTGKGSSYMVAGSFKVNQAAVQESGESLITASEGALYGTAGKPERMTIQLPAFAPGESIELEFEQYYAKPLPTADCAAIPGSFIEGHTYYLGQYTNEQGCDENGNPPTHMIDSLVTKNGLKYAFFGENMGEVDIVEGESYAANYLIDQWLVPSEGIEDGAYFEFNIKLAAALLPFDKSQIKLFNGSSYLSTSEFSITENSPGDYTLRIDYGGTVWPTNQPLYFPEGGWKLQFPLDLNCPAPEAFYEISASLNKGGACTTNIPFRCQKVVLNVHCPDDCLDGGLINGLARLKRVTLGYADADNDARPDNNTLLEPNDDLSTIETHSFTGGDVIMIQQDGYISANYPAENTNNSWKDGKFIVKFPADMTGEVLARSGRVELISMDPNIASLYVSNLPVETSGNNYILKLNIQDWLADPEVDHNLPANFSFDGIHRLLSSLEFRVTTQIAAKGLKEFATEYYVSHNGKNYGCGGGYEATGYYGSTVLKTGSTGVVFNMKDCSSDLQGPTWMSSIEVAGHHTRNALFQNEFRQFATLKKVNFTVPAGLSMTGYKVEVHHNSPGPVLSEVVNIAAVSDEVFEADLKAVLERLKGGTTGGYLDEGFEIYVRPIVTINCNAALKEKIIATSVFAGTFRYNNVDYFDADEVQTVSQTLEYNTDNNKLEVKVSSTAASTTTSEVTWRVSVKNNSANRAFKNIWLAKSAGAANADIVRVQQITSLTDTTALTGNLPVNNGIFQLGDVSQESTSYYLLTAKVEDCAAGSIEIVSGADCIGYPQAINTACTFSPIKLSYKFEEALLQADIRETVLGAGGTHHLCAKTAYVVEINNAGQEAKDLMLTIPLAHMPGFNYEPNSLTVSGIYTSEEQNPQLISLADLGNILQTPDGITINIPTSSIAKLQIGERFYIGFTMVIEGCDFISGRRFKVIPAGKNFCDMPISQVTTAETNRIIVEGAPVEEPSVILTSDVVLDPSFMDGRLHALYNFNLKNTAINGPGYPLTGTAAQLIDPAAYAYSFAVKLPSGWIILGNPQDLIASSIANYTGQNADNAYVFTLNETLAVGAELHIKNANLFYSNIDATSLICGHDFGPVHVELFTTYTAQGSTCIPPINCETKLIVADHDLPFIVNTPELPIADTEQIFCESDRMTLADVVVSNPFALTWYESATGINILQNTTVLVDGRTYYAVNKLTSGAVCVSDRLAITIKLVEEPVADAGADQESFDSPVFVLNANQPAAGQTGLWTVISNTGEPVVIADPTLYNTTVTIPGGAEVELKWTVVNGSCSAEDTVWLKLRPIVDLSIEKKADKPNYVVGDKVNYTLTVKNNGPGSLFKDQELTIKDLLPAELQDVSYATVGGSYNPANGSFKLAADLPKSGVVSLLITATIAVDYTGATILNTASVLPPTGVEDPNLENNDDEETIIIDRLVDLAVRKQADQETVEAGNPLSYTIELVNNGSGSLLTGEEIRIVERLPLGFEAVTFTSSTGVFDSATGVLKLTQTFAKTDKIVLTVRGTVSANFVGNSIYNKVTAAVPPGVTDPNLENNTDEETVLVTHLVDLMITKTVLDPKPIIGTETTFSIQVTNKGLGDATGVQVVDLLHSGYRFVSATVSKGNYVASTGLWTIGDMKNGAVESLTVTVLVLPEGDYANAANVTGNEKDPNPGNNEVIIVPVPILSPPIAVDDKETTKVNTPVDIFILENDRPGLTNSPLVPGSIEIISQPKNGSIELLADGTVIYTPNPGFVGEDTFVYRVKDELGFWSNNATVTITIEANDFFIPNIFTPNGDGTNDNFEIVGIEGFDRVALTIVNRWGNEVYRNDKYDNTWSGKGLNEGTYYYIITLYKAGTQKVLKGWVAIKTK